MPSYVIVGASRGLGYQFLKTLSKRDSSNTVVGLVRTRASTQPQVQSDNLTNVHVLYGDLTNAASLNTAAEETANVTSGVIDHLIINGAYMSESSHMMTPKDFVGKEEYFLNELTQCMTTNAAGILFSVQAFLPLLRKSSIKKVTVISSAMGDLEATLHHLGDSGLIAVPYSMSKSAANLLTARLAVELRPEGIIFLSISPGAVATHDVDLENLPPKQAEFMKGIFANFQKIYPNWTGPLAPADSVDMCLKVIESHQLKDTGAFLSHYGNNKQWL